MSLDVLLPYYGDPEYMRLAVRSVLAQTSPDWRLIVTDDCYPDPTIGPWFAGLADARIDYSRNEENLGANRNYTHALSKASAEWVVVMGADDVMLPRFVERTLELTSTSGPGRVDVVQGGVDVIDGNGLAVRPRVDAVKARLRPEAPTPVAVGGEDLLTSLLRGNWTYFPSIVWRREVIAEIGFRPDFHVVQDLGLLVDVVRRGGLMALDDEVTFLYRRHAGSDSAVKTVLGERFAEESAYFATIAADLEAQGMRRAARAARVHLTSRLHALSLLPTALTSRQPAAAGRLLRHAVGPARR